NFPHQVMVEQTRKHLAFLNEVQPDGIILADTGVLQMANELCPNIDKHLSVQSTTVNEPGMRFWYQNGVKRIILARELPIAEVKSIHEIFPELELEYFVHGAICMAYSGRCLLSNFMAARDANRGACAHSCRWNYRVYDENGYELNHTNNLPLAEEKKEIHSLESKLYLEEELRPHEFIPAEEDFHGTHIMSSRDMCMIEHLEEIANSGVISVKVEGRNKTIYYLATIARAYRQALDDLGEGKPFNPQLWAEVKATANRGFFAGFLHGKPFTEGQQYEANLSTADADFVGQVIKTENGRVEILVKNRLDIGDEIEFLFPRLADDVKLKIDQMWKNGQLVNALHGGDGNGEIACEINIPPQTLIRKKLKLGLPT
ncbi:MAG TPA: U32 family peptidase C-terminal domain-containing protein, partial [Candidatus Gracilibacteria bacterium]|nr:U32 family peptidase C-terminal domain-containing protein [Candidatus Gracilibacteria bacterium]